MLQDIMFVKRKSCILALSLRNSSILTFFSFSSERDTSSENFMELLPKRLMKVCFVLFIKLLGCDKLISILLAYCQICQGSSIYEPM